MTLVDWAVVVIMVCAVLGGLIQGFFRSACSLGGLILGLVVAAWNYARVASIILPLVRIPAVANTIGFLFIALVVMALIGLIGNLLAKAFRLLGLGWLDGLAGAVFGFFQGVLLVVIGILVVVAFFPQAHWIADARLPRMFFGACHVSANVTPGELGDRVRQGLRAWEAESPRWMHPG
ncbi:MAG TPA: CvpA family protein [Terracidiphilus sp.]|jgi:membrane protein required for colicin V production|nr:CvpA family protein [Terracidiphilus sp.]